MNLTTEFSTYENIKLEKLQYANGNLAIQLYCEDGEPLATLTTNLGNQLKPNMAYLDTNNCPWAEQFVKENELAKETGKLGFSGYCTYPLYEFI